MPIRIDKVYTRQGDRGGTRLVGGQQVRKSCLQVESYGEIDELNSVLGLLQQVLISSANVDFVDLADRISEFQQDLFNIGAELATPMGESYEGMPKITSSDVDRIEQLCDRFSDNLPALTSFILPGGSMVAANFHLARSVARRAERAVVRFFDDAEPDIPRNWSIVQYLNRINDLFFILARWSLMLEGVEVPLWHQGKR